MTTSLPPVVNAEVPFPSGDVTFLFTDIEGSTRLWERDADVMWRALDQHHRLLKSAITAHGGVPFKTIGDAFQAAFPSSPLAIAAAVEAQRALSAARWEETGPIRVRMAIHVGEARPSSGDYTAPCLNRLARLLSTGYGGQVLITDVVRSQVANHLPSGVTLFDLGRHRLRDLLEPEQVAQLVIADLPDRFPPLKSLEGYPTNLPIQPTELVGRETELVEIRKLIDAPTPRLITLTGMGGTGKTRLAIQCAAEAIEGFADGVFLVDLAPVVDPTLVIPTIARSLGVREGGGLTLLEALVTFLSNKRLLLVLDNFEHLVAAAPAVAEVLSDPRCRELKVLVTSRELLQVRGEHAYAVPPLPTPDLRRLPPPDDLLAIGAVALFVQRATKAGSEFALTSDNARVVAEICVRLDGLPLAIELAAARIKLLTPRGILARLGSQLKLLTGGTRDLPERQRTLRATIEWSHDLLTEGERVLFRRLAVFAGGGTIESAETIASAAGGLELDILDGLEWLVDKSLLRRLETSDGETRFAMLETLREFGLERLVESGEEAETRRAHAAWSLDLAETASVDLSGPDQNRGLQRLDAEHENLRAALAWGLDMEPTLALRLAGSLGQFWHIRGYLSEGRSWFQRALSVSVDAPLPDRIEALTEAGTLATDQGDYAEADSRYEAGLTLARELGDRRGYARLLNLLGGMHLERGDLDRATTMLEESLVIHEELSDRRGYASTLTNLGAVAQYAGDHAKARDIYERCLVLWRHLGDKREIGTVLFNLLTLSLEDPLRNAQARECGEECLNLSRELGDPQGEAFALSGLALLARAEGDLDRAMALDEASLALFRELGDKGGEARILGNLAITVFDQGDCAKAASLCGESLSSFAAIGDDDGLSLGLEFLSEIATALGRSLDGARLLGAAEELRKETGAPPPALLQRRQQGVKDAIEAKLGRAELGEAWAAWCARSTEEIIASALTIVAVLASSPSE